jgi:hypothetical protein
MSIDSSGIFDSKNISMSEIKQETITRTQAEQEVYEIVQKAEKNKTNNVVVINDHDDTFVDESYM